MVVDPDDTAGLLARLAEGAAQGIARELTDDLADRAYADRNLAVIALATDRYRMGCDAGWYDADDDGTDYPVVWAVLPTGQVSWHVTPDLRALLEDAELPETEPPAGYDGHSRDLKNRRVAYHAVGTDQRVTEG